MARPEFDPEDPFDIKADAAKSRMLEFLSDDLLEASEPEDFEALICGYMTGIFVGLMAVTRTEGYDAIEAYITEYAPIAAEQARAIVNGATTDG